MVSGIKRRLRDVRTIKTLCLEAEKHAHEDGQKEPGSEHFVLAALALPDGTARNAFERLYIDPSGFQAAIAKQYADALRQVGMALPPHGAVHDSAPPMPGGAGIYQAQASAQSLMQRLASHRKTDAKAPLLGSHDILAVATAQMGVAVRALRGMGIEPAKLAEAATA